MRNQQAMKEMRNFCVRKNDGEWTEMNGWDPLAVLNFYILHSEFYIGCF